MGAAPTPVPSSPGELAARRAALGDRVQLWTCTTRAR
jgi:hypothetical protein